MQPLCLYFLFWLNSPSHMLSRFQKTTHTQQQVEDSTVACVSAPRTFPGQSCYLVGGKKGPEGKMARGLICRVGRLWGAQHTVSSTGCFVGRELLWRCFKPCSKQTREIIAASWAVVSALWKVKPLPQWEQDERPMELSDINVMIFSPPWQHDFEKVIVSPGRT